MKNRMKWFVALFFIIPITLAKAEVYKIIRVEPTSKFGAVLHDDKGRRHNLSCHLFDPDYGEVSFFHLHVDRLHSIQFFRRSLDNCTMFIRDVSSSSPLYVQTRPATYTWRVYDTLPAH